VVRLFVGVVLRYKRTKWRVARLAARSPRGAAAPAAQAAWAAFHEDLGALLYVRLMALGGLWLKIGQYMASRSDMVPLRALRPPPHPPICVE
jgi:predicted unusual protein kinase regulating ubiquinone biosynthesis (AarF/ABC1/UbiB family)